MDKTHCAVTHHSEQGRASRNFPAEDAAMLHFLFDGVSLPFDPPPGAELPPPTHFEQVCGFAVLYFLLLTLISFLLPRPWFVALFKIAFPFMPDRLEDADDN